MELLKIDELFMLRGQSMQNYPFIIVGLVKHTLTHQEFHEIGLAISSLTFSGECSPVQLDLLLANKLALVSGYLSIAGCTMHLPHSAGFSGGVLGDPSNPPSHAESILENISNGWTLLTFPESPGMACDSLLPDIPNAIILRCKTGVPDHNTLLSLSLYSEMAGAKRCIAITDGSGVGAVGAALIRK
jgi:hypothetical protein